MWYCVPSLFKSFAEGYNTVTHWILGSNNQEFGIHVSRILSRFDGCQESMTFLYLHVSYYCHDIFTFVILLSLYFIFYFTLLPIIVYRSLLFIFAYYDQFPWNKHLYIPCYLMSSLLLNNINEPSNVTPSLRPAYINCFN